jgi:hypothetical protein
MAGPLGACGALLLIRIQVELSLDGLLGGGQITDGAVGHGQHQPTLTEFIVHLGFQQINGRPGPACKDEMSRPGKEGHAPWQGVRQPGSIEALGGQGLPKKEALHLSLDSQPTRRLMGELIHDLQQTLQLGKHVLRGSHAPKALQDLEVAEFEISLFKAGVEPHTLLEEPFLSR